MKHLSNLFFMVYKMRLKCKINPFSLFSESKSYTLLSSWMALSHNDSINAEKFKSRMSTRNVRHSIVSFHYLYALMWFHVRKPHKSSKYIDRHKFSQQSQVCSSVKVFAPYLYTTISVILRLYNKKAIHNISGFFLETA